MYEKVIITYMIQDYQKARMRSVYILLWSHHYKDMSIFSQIFAGEGGSVEKIEECQSKQMASKQTTPSKQQNTKKKSRRKALKKNKISSEACWILLLLSYTEKRVMHSGPRISDQWWTLTLARPLNPIYSFSRYLMRINFVVATVWVLGMQELKNKKGRIP